MIVRWMIVLALMAIPALPGALPSFPGSSIEPTAEALRALYVAADYHGAYNLGVDSPLPSSQARTWWLLAAARIDREEEAVAAAEAWTAESPDDAWAWAALAGALAQTSGRGDDAVVASELSLELEPDHLDLWLIHADTLVYADKHDEAIAFVDAHADDSVRSGELLVAKANALFSMAYGSQGVDTSKFDQALETCERALALDPSSARAHYLAGVVLGSSRRTAEALAHFEQAIRLSPGAIRVRTRYWRSIVSSADLDGDQKVAMLDASVADLLQHQPDQAAALNAARSAYDSLGADELRDAVAARILDEYPDSAEAEWTLVASYRELRKAFAEEEDDPDPELHRRYRELLGEFINRPEHRQERLLGDAYRELWRELSEDDATTAEELLAATNGMAKHEGINPHLAFAQGAIKLAEKTDYHGRAEELARQGIEEGRKKIESQRSFYSTQAAYDRSLNWMLAQMYDALGWVLFQADRLDDAEAELLHSYETDPKSRVNLFHLGQFNESLGRREVAENFYVQGLAVQQPGDNPNRAALEELYAQLHDSSDRFDDYLAEIEARESEKRHKEILASRIEEPERAPDFSLRTLDGSTMSLDDLEGKVAVVNFWGIWCFWCIIEMPELQQLHEKFADDPDVVIVTINNDDNPADVPIWMEANSYAFPVLFDDGYVTAKAGINAFPTTWFLDPQGRIAFEKANWSQELLEEYSWRIEMLRQQPQ